MPRPSPRSLKWKLALLVFGVTALALSAIFFYVVPQLRSNLREQRLRDLERVAAVSSDPLEAVMGREISARRLDELVRAVADRSDAQVSLLGVQRSGGGANGGSLQFYLISDSRAERQVRENPGLAARAVRSRSVATAAPSLNGSAVGQAAQPLFYRGRADWVAVYSRSLDDVSETFGLIRTRVLLASMAALLVALAGGYLIARLLARRVERVERAAKEVAAGHFIDPLPVDSEDELGRLTRTFNEMQEQLARMDRARKEFIANASHELRTPIFSLGGFVEILQNEDLDQETREEFLETMREQVERLGKLAVDLLDLSRLDAGSLQLESERVDLTELARDVAGEFRPAFGQHGTDFRLDLDGRRVEARADPERVAQIMRILLDNALRHTPEGTRVTVSAERRDGAAEVAVSDTGPGLDSAVAAQLFERFYTADAARGSGLGLAIARELAERMSGRIDLRSAPGQTVFTLALPALDDEVAG